MKAVFISSMLPSGHFSQILTNGLARNKDIDLTVYTDLDPKNRAIKGCGNIKPVWSRSAHFIYQILKEILKDKPDIIHIQQEFNMYGTIKTAVLFPFLPLILKLLGRKVIVTIHAAVYKNQVDKEFITLFTSKENLFINPFTLRLFFLYIYSLTSLFSDAVICHTKLLKEMLVKDWHVNPNKTFVIPTGIPSKQKYNGAKGNYFLYFGYMVRRNGLDYVIDGFAKFLKRNRQFRLVLAGGIIKGQEDAFEELKNYIRKKKVGSFVDIKGFVEERQQDELFKKAYVVLIPARVSMGSSGRLYHAQSYGKCIITSNVGHFKEDINPMVDGILTDNNRWDKALNIVVRSKQLVKTIEANVLKKAKIKSAFAIARKHIEIYRLLAYGS